MVGLRVPTCRNDLLNKEPTRSMDFVHTVMVCIANWLYLIEHFGDTSGTDEINWYEPCLSVFHPLSPILF